MINIDGLESEYSVQHLFRLKFIFHMLFRETSYKQNKQTEKKRIYICKYMHVIKIFFTVFIISHNSVLLLLSLLLPRTLFSCDKEWNKLLARSSEEHLDMLLTITKVYFDKKLEILYNIKPWKQ